MLGKIIDSMGDENIIYSEGHEFPLLSPTAHSNLSNQKEAIRGSIGSVPRPHSHDNPILQRELIIY